MFRKRLFLYMANPAPKDAGNSYEACLRRLGTFDRSGKRGHEIGFSCPYAKNVGTKRGFLTHVSPLPRAGARKTARR